MNNVLGVILVFLEGIFSVLENMFIFLSLYVDVCVFEKIWGKNWNNEYIDISCFFNNFRNKDCY